MQTRRLLSVVAIALLLVPPMAPGKVSAEVSTGVSAVADVVATDIPSQSAEDFLSDEIAPSQDETAGETIPTEEFNPTELPVPADESTALKDDPDEPSPLLEGEGSGELSTPKPQRLPSAPQSAGQFTADLFTGSATYGYQFSFPEGRAGLTPPIALRYSSARRTDLGRVGMRGWDIEVGHVERTSKQGVDKLYATSAAFTLYPPGSGAVELVPLQLEADGIHGTYGAETENDFALVTFATSNSWTVVDRGGTTWTYGTSSASREYDPADESRVSSWYVAGATGPTGATMRYGYLRHGNALYAASVDYGGQIVGGSEETGPFRVELEYGSMADRVISYRTGYPVYRQLKLGEVRAFVNGSLRQQYNFGPASGGAAGVASLLDYIQETRYSATGSAITLPATSFQYHAVPTTTWSTVTGTTTATFPQALASCQDQTCIDMNVLSVDLNGDGRQEVIRPQFNAQDGLSEFHLAERTHSLRGDGTWSDDTSWDLAVPGVGSSNELGAGRVHYLDLNGDGRTDALVARRRQNGTDDRRVYLNTGTTWELNASWTVPMYVYGDNLVGDFNGDGLPDFATSSAMSVNSSGYTAAEMSAVYLNTGSGWELNASWTVPFALKVCAFHAGVCDTGLIPFYRDEQYKYRLMELNGDGLPDIVYSWENDSTGQQRAVFLNTGTGWVATTTASQWGSFPSWYKCQVSGYLCGLESQAPSSPAHTQTVDLNGDRIDDVLFTHLVNGTAELHPGVIGQGVVGVPHGLPKLELAIELMGTASKSRFGDFNGDGQLDLGWAHEASTTHDYRRYIQVNQPDYLLKAVVEPTGATTTLAYTEAHQYFDAASSTVPLSGALPYAVWTPSRVTVAPGNGQPELVTDYTYEGGAAAFTSSTDREFAGFWKVSATSGSTKTITEFHQGIGGLPLTTSTQLHPDRGQYSDEPAKRGRVYRTEVRDASSDDLLSAQVTKWESATLDGPNRKFVYPSRTTSFVAKASGLDATAVERTFDTATGNELSTFSRGSVTADSGTGDISGELGTDQSTEDKEYATSSSARILGAPKLAQVKDASQQVIAEKEIRYDGLPLGQVSQGKPTRVEDKLPSSAVYATYDSYANVASSSDPRGATTTFQYDATYHLAPTRSVNPLGQATLQEVDLATRQLVSTTDANGARERWIRDGFGRPLERWIQNPTTTGVVLAERWAYGDADRPVWVRHEAFDSVGDATPSTDYAYADGAGRVIQTRAQEDASTFIVGDTQYDSQGKVARQSLPYRGSGSGYATPASGVPSTSYAYDAAGRVTAVYAPAGNTTVAYDGLVTRVTDALGRVAEQERDGQGRLVRVTRWLNSQPITYSYSWDAAGRLTGMQDPGGNTREFTYDGQGRLLTQTDWHATSSSPDTWAYAYDAAGNVTSSTDPRGATIHYTYDALNRALTANDPSTAGTDTTYSYDDTGSHGVGRLHEAIHRGVRSTYDYDRLGRTTTVDRDILGKRLVQDYRYDLVGRELERDEPNGYKVWATYDRLGRWATTTATVGTTTATVASALSYTPLGQLESVLYGNGLVTRDTYTPEDGYLLARRTTGEEGSYLQDLNYEYDAVGNVTNLVDASVEPLGSDRRFEYDDLDRLVGVQGTYAGSEDASSTFSYDTLGNMRIRGNYSLYRLSYLGHPYRPSHAVIGGDGLMPFSWDAAGNLVEVGANLYQYDGFGRLATATYSNDDTFLDTFAYGHSGSRVYRSHDVVGDELDTVATYSLGTYEEDSDGAARQFIDAPGRRLAQVTLDPSGGATIQHLHQDALGSSPLSTDGSGDLASAVEQDPYGLPRLEKLNGGPAPTRSYTGKELDPSSWYYFGARYFSPEMARFTQVDPATMNLASLGHRELNGLLADPWRYLQPYAYAANNPVRYVDPTGGGVKDFAKGVASGAWTGLKQTGAGLAAVAQDPTVIATSIAQQYAQAFADAKTLGASLSADPQGTVHQVAESFRWAGEAWSNLSDEKKGEIVGYAAEKAGEAYLGARGASSGFRASRAAGKSSVAAEGGAANLLDINQVPQHAYRMANKYESYRVLENGNVRYYTKFRPARTPGPTKGARYVTEVDQTTGEVTRTWQELYNQDMTVREVHPKTPQDLGHIRQNH